jgi:putative spermidine/putrescine transport system permease protein
MGLSKRMVGNRMLPETTSPVRPSTVKERAGKDRPVEAYSGMIRLGRALTLLTLAFIFAPIAMSVLGSVSPAWHKGLLNGFTLQWYASVIEDYSQTIWLSLLVAAACMLVNLVLGTLAGYALARYRWRGSRLLEQALLIPLAVPGIALALALIQSYPLILGSWLFILIGHVVFTFPFMLNSTLSGMRSTGLAQLEETAASLGAGWWFRFLHVVLPNVWRALINGMLLVFTISVGEFNLTFFLATPLTMTLPVGLFEAYASLRLEIASAYTVIFFLLIVPCLVAMQYLGRKGLAPWGNA